MDNAGHDGIGVYASPSVSRDSFETTLRATLRGQTTLVVSTSKQLKETSLSVFDRTFLITELLRTIAIAVSFVGVFGALLAQQLEKTREYGVLRAIGFSNGEMMRTVLAQTTTLGLAAAGIAIPVGLLIGIVLIEIVNPRSFGWTMSMTISPSQIAGSCLVALFAAIIAGIYPAYRAAHIEPAVAIREE